MKKEKSVEKQKLNKIAVIRVKGSVRIRTDFKDTLKMLNLHKKNHCVILNATPAILGMVRKVKDFVTWGEVNEETEELLKEGRKEGRKFFNLSPPRGGYGRKGTKIPFKLSGALGYRGEKINELIKKMI